MQVQRKWLYTALLVCAFVAALLAAAMPQPNAATAGVDNGYYGKKAKYVFYFIGDGMAMAQINAAEIFKGTTGGGGPMSRVPLNFATFPNQGMQTTHSANTFITESAAAGTALATGHKTNNDVLGMDSGKTVKYRTMAELAKEKGLKVGIVTSVSLDHATPGAFYAHEPTRKNYYEIGLAMVNSGFDYFAGGGLLSPAGPGKDRRNVLDIARGKGYKVVNSREGIAGLSKEAGKVIAINPILANEEALEYEIDRTDQLSLADFTRKGIELLDNPAGFFLMVEGGKVDWAAHANDAATTIRDVLAFEAAIGEALRFYASHPDETLIVVTGDHETGGMSIGFAGTEYQTFFAKLGKQALSFEEFDKQIKAYRRTTAAADATLADWLPVLAERFGLDNLTDYERSRLEAALAATMLEPKKRNKDPYSYLLYGTYEPFSVTVTHILNQRAGIGWTTYAHTGVAVPVFAQGVGGGLFQGYYDNTDIAKKIMNIMGVQFQ
ncbi:MAG TPA: alkaline phosphatase [Negativicutes bacterium]|nr:alkaline phosphatase [Negativicutes bacterium]